MVLGEPVCLVQMVPGGGAGEAPGVGEGEGEAATGGAGEGELPDLGGLTPRPTPRPTARVVMPQRINAQNVQQDTGSFLIMLGSLGSVLVNGDLGALILEWRAVCPCVRGNLIGAQPAKLAVPGY